MALTIAATTALGVGAATGLFLYLATFLFPRIAARSPERVGFVYLGEQSEPRPMSSYLELERLRAARGFEAVAANSALGATIQVGGVSSFAWGQFVGGEFFDFFEGAPAVGRLLVPGDEQPGAPPVAVLSYRLWRGLFGSDPGVVGRAATVNGEIVTVVGVAAPGFVGTSARVSSRPWACRCARVANWMLATPRVRRQRWWSIAV